MINRNYLQLDTVIDTEKGSMTLGEFWISTHKKLRCEATFRPESNSQAALLSRFGNGVPFLFDQGSRTKYLVADDSWQGPPVDDWPEESRSMPGFRVCCGRQEVVQRSSTCLCLTTGTSK